MSLSEENFLRANDRWSDPERVNEATYFGWFQTVLPGYSDTLNIKTMVHTQAVGTIPQIEVIDEAHLLTAEQSQGITWQRVFELVEAAMHD